jgi:hypothetical protein
MKGCIVALVFIPSSHSDVPCLIGALQQRQLVIFFKRVLKARTVEGSFKFTGWRKKVYMPRQVASYFPLKNKKASLGE